VYSNRQNHDLLHFCTIRDSKHWNVLRRMARAIPRIQLAFISPCVWFLSVGLFPQHLKAVTFPHNLFCNYMLCFSLSVRSLAAKCIYLVSAAFTARPTSLLATAKVAQVSP
jgi:hypothetical protein